MEIILVIIQHVWDFMTYSHVQNAILAGPLLAIPAAFGAGGAATGGLGGLLGLSGTAATAANLGGNAVGSAITAPGSNNPIQQQGFRQVSTQLSANDPIQQQQSFSAQPLQVQKVNSDPFGDIGGLLNTLSRFGPQPAQGQVNDQVLQNSVSRAISPGQLAPPSMPGLFGDVGSSLGSGLNFRR